MGNRAYVTLNNETFYVHWNGGLDTFCPLIEAVQCLKRENLRPTSTEIQAAFLEFCGQKMEKFKGTQYESKQLIEENGHYFIDLSLMTVIHRLEVENKVTKMDDVVSRLIVNPHNYFLEYFIPRILPDYVEKAKKEYPERVKIFLESLNKLMVPRLEAEKIQKEKLKEDSKKTFKTLIKEDLKRDFPSILKKLKSVKYKSYSMGCSLNVVCIDLDQKEYDYMRGLVKEYQYGYFNGSEDIYEYQDSKKARSAKYCFLENEKSTNEVENEK